MLDKTPRLTVAPKEKSQRTSNILIRGSGVSLFFLLALAYLTGEEFRHTHEIIGYGIAALLVAGLGWEFLRSRYEDNSIQPSAPGSASVALFATFLVLTILALFTLLLIGGTHTLWGVSVDEMHEVVAYFALGLTIVYVVTVFIVSFEVIENQRKKPGT